MHCTMSWRRQDLSSILEFHEYCKSGICQVELLSKVVISSREKRGEDITHTPFPVLTFWLPRG